MIKFAIVRPTWAQSWSDKDSTRALQNVNFVLLYGQLSINQYTRQNYVNISVSLSAKVPGFLIYTDLNYFLYMLQSTSQKSMNIKGLKHNTIQSLAVVAFKAHLTEGLIFHMALWVHFLPKCNILAMSNTSNTISKLSCQ